MKLNFHKYHGTGNDFVIVDDRQNSIHLEQAVIERICDRRFGIGADGLLLLRNKKGYDFEMIYYNSDGRLSSMCGNGSRCLTRFAHQLGIVKDQTTFLAADGDHEARIVSTNPFIVKVKMKDVDNIEKTDEYLFLDTGSPHCVLFVEQPDALDIVTEARKIRYGTRFNEQGTNVNFIHPSEKELYVRSYERGVEDETFSCGTGVVASAIATAYINSKLSSNGVMPVRTKGGNLKVYFEKNGLGYRNIWLEGPAEFVFEGKLEF